MSNDNTQDGAEPSPASAGSQPVAWIAVFDGHDADGEFVWPDRGRAMEWASARQGVTIAPLYLQPQPTLTDEEREALEWAAEEAKRIADAAWFGDASLERRWVALRLLARRLG
jgi:hypothetical protein